MMFKKVYSTKINVIANFAGSVWIAFLSIVFVPYYLHYIGVESYGLIGVFNSIQAFIALLDFGLSPTLNREFSRLSVIEGSAQEMRDLQRTLEIPNWICAGLIALLLSLLAPLLAHYWIQPKDLSVQTVMQALIIMGVNIAILFTVNFYTGGLMGLQKQLLLSYINILCGSLRSAGAFLVLVFISPTIQAFLLWQGAVALLQVVLMAITLRKSLPIAPVKGHFQKVILQKVWRFAAGMTGITIVSLILTQTDKILLSRLLNLEQFGFYTIAITISGMAIGMIVSAINHAVYPQFSRLVSLGDENALREFYHRSCQIMSVFLLPVIIILALFSYEVLMVWIQKQEIAENIHVLLTLVAIGNGLNSLMWLPYSMQLAHGWTKLGFYSNVVAIIFLIPLIVLGVNKYGAVGGAAAGVFLNASHFIITIQVMHRRILKGEQWRWYFEDLAVPFFVALVTAGIGKMLLPASESRLLNIFGLAVVSAVTFLLTVFSTKATREVLKNLGGQILVYLRGGNKVLQK